MNLYGHLYRSVLLPAFDGLLKRRNTIRYWQLAERTQWLDRQSLERQQLVDLKALLEYAFANCDHYRDRWTKLGLDPRAVHSLQDFQSWPLLTRESIRLNRMQMRSRAGMKRITKSTGGSTGQPLVFDIDHDSNERRTAMTFRGYGWARSGPGTRRLLIWGADLKRPSFWRSLKISMHNRFEQQRVLNCFDFSHDKMKKQFDAMQHYRPETVIAYTGPLYEFARFLNEHSLRPQGIGSIVVGAEKLYDFQRQLIEQVFQAPVFETYGSREFMLIGAECELHCGLHLSMENLLVEILDENGLPTVDGDEGNVVITDLFNRGMPFIRYVNGDRAIAGFHQCNCGRGLPMLRNVVGRQLDVISTPAGKTIPGELFPHLFKDYAAVRRYQVQQHHPDQIDVKLVSDGTLTVEDCHGIRDRIAMCLNHQVHVRLDLVDEIPLTLAGKRQVVVNYLSRSL